MEFAWALDYPEVLSICEKFNMSEISNPKYVCYKSLQGILQQGPQCGLVALSICMKSPTRETISRLLREAQELNFTYNGEMFSAKDMLALTRRFLPNSVTLYEGVLDSPEIKEFLSMGGMLIVPYDSDKNHAPCCMKGHKSHWAVISGIIQCDITYVIARHGKSIHIAIWNLSDLSESNLQLEEFAPHRKLHNVSYKLPDGGINGENGLNGRTICIYPLNCGMVMVPDLSFFK